MSKLAYIDFSAYVRVLALGQAVPINQIDYSQAPQVASGQNNIEQMGNWQLINYVNKNNSSGYCGAAFLNSQTGDIAFASRGTEAYVLQYGMGDIKQDVQLALVDGPFGTNNQFVDALAFVTDTLSRVSGQTVDRSNLSRFVSMYKVSFAGHSLGGGISEFLTYLTGGRSVTFNGVGIGQAIHLDRATASGYNTLHLVISADLTGNYGIPLGQVRSLADDLPKSGPDPGDYIDPLRISRLTQIINKYAQGEISTTQFYSSFSTELVSMNNVTRNYILSCIGFKTHDLELFQSHINPYSNSLTIGIVSNDSYAKEIADALLNLSAEWSPTVDRFLQYWKLGVEALQGWGGGDRANQDNTHTYDNIKTGINITNTAPATYEQKWQDNFEINRGPSNPVFVHADLIDGYTLDYNPNGVLWNVNASGIPTIDDFNKFVEQNRIIEITTNQTTIEMQDDKMT